VTTIDLDNNIVIEQSNCYVVYKLIARNRRFRSLFLFDARQMLLSLMCADWCGLLARKRRHRAALCQRASC
jgi:hypothetical protein